MRDTEYQVARDAIDALRKWEPKRGFHERQEEADSLAQRLAAVSSDNENLGRCGAEHG